MKNSKEGISCKAFTLPGIDGGEITFSETMDRLSILITATGKDGLICRLHIAAEQFAAMCDFDSHYDGLTVRQSAPAEVIDADFPIAQLEDPQ